MAVNELLASLNRDAGTPARSIVLPTRLLIGDSAPLPPTAS
jgi:hypothetical protein